MEEQTGRGTNGWTVEQREGEMDRQRKGQRDGYIIIAGS